MKIGIAGLGLIGGSLALALRERHDVTGFDISREARAAASASGVVAVDSLERLLPADAVIVATPLGAVLPTLAALADGKRRTVLFDTASVRGPVDAYAREHRGATMVGLHPMAGRSGGQGFAIADAALLEGRPFLIVPTATSDDEAMKLAGQLARDAGGVPTVCSAAEHDRIVALVSALPVAIATALAATAAEGVPGLATFAGPALRDTTRVALTPPDLAETILLANSGNVVAALAKLRTVLDEIERAVAERDPAGLREVLERGSSARAALG